MLKFYCEALGCEVERRNEELGLIQLRAGDCLIDLVTVDGKLGRMGGRAPEREGRNVDHFCLQVDDFDPEAVRDHLRKHGIETGPAEERYGAGGLGLSVYATDPDENVVELRAAT